MYPMGGKYVSHMGEVTKFTTIYNSREKFELYWFLVSRKHLKPSIRQYKCYHILSIVQQFYRYRR